MRGSKVMVADVTFVADLSGALFWQGRHLLAVRAYLNIEALPALMRPLAYATPSWYLGTGWSEWPVQP